jgi:hypothetical protein
MLLPELTEDERNTLLLMCGYATGAAMKSRERKLGISFLRLTNRLFEGSPNYVPYQLPDEE